jgi:thiol-disulfide isomerase/thioredoxin
MNKRAAIAFIVVALAAAAVGAYFANRHSDSKAPFARSARPKPMPELRFNDADGRAHTLADFRGKVVLLNIWATWCEPCREEMPALDRLQAKLGGERFQVVALSVDQQGPEVARKFFADVGVKSLALYVDRSAQATFKLGAVGLPSTLLVDPRGREIGRHVGPAKWDSPEVVDELRKRIASLEH